MKTRALLIMVLIGLALLASCGGGGGGGGTNPPPPQEQTAIKLYTYPDGSQWIVAAPGIALANSDIVIVADSQQYTTTATPDGAIYYRFTIAGVHTVSVDYQKADGGRLNVRPQAYVISENLTHDFLPLGMAPNDFIFFGGKCYVVNSSDNNLVIYNTSDWSQVGGMTFPAGASPSYIFVRDGLGVVTCNGNNRVYVFDPADGTELWSELLPANGLVFLGPGRPYADQDRIYVPLANIREFGALGDSTLYDNAQLAIINIASKHLETEVTLTGYDAVETVLLPGNLLAICEAGDLSFDTNFVPFVFNSTWIDIYDLSEQAITRSINIGVVGGGRLLYDDSRQRLLVGSLIAGTMYEINTTNWLIERGMLNPINLTDNMTFISDMEIVGNSVFVSSFNEDLIYSLNAEEYTLNVWPLPQALPLEQQALFLTGPQKLYYDGTAKSVFILEALANRIAKFDLPK
jgi:hypothetical protein